MNAIVTVLAEQGLVLGAILLLAIFLQAKIHNLGTALRGEMSSMKDDLLEIIGKVADRVGETEVKLVEDMSNMRDDLRKEMSSLKDDLSKEMSSMKDGLRKEMSSMKDGLREEMSGMKEDLRKDMGDLGERLARIEGPLPRGAKYDAVAERSPEDENPSR